jgi:hypothetical protein
MDATHPAYGEMDEKLALWLGVAAFPKPSEDDDDSRFARRPRTATPSPVSRRADRLRARSRLDAMETLMRETRDAEARARTLETRNEALETDLYAAAVVWEETESENRSLRARVAALETEAADAETARARAEPGRDFFRAEAARHSSVFKPRSRDDRGSVRAGFRCDVVENANPKKPLDDRPKVSFVRDEVEELEACASLMRRSMGADAGRDAARQFQ